MDNHKTTQYLSGLISKFTDGTITDEELRKLETKLLTNPEARRYYIESRIIHSLFGGRRNVDTSDTYVRAETEGNYDFLYALAAYEKIAPEVEICEENPSRELIQKVVYPLREKQKVSKLSVFIVLLNAAAILFFIVFAHFAPTKSGYTVSTLTDSVRAKWVGKDTAIPVGHRLTAGRRFVLDEGLAELLFDSQARVTLEAPADFVILGDNQIKLNYGGLFADVPRAAVGFSVVTPNSKMIDLGTQFGVMHGIDGTTEAHVFEGQIALFVDQADQQFSIIVKEGYAKRVDENNHISMVNLKNNFFVRKINSSNDIMWRGGNICLADIVTNGNGLGSGDPEWRLNYVKGFTKDVRWGHVLTSKDYLPIKEHPFVDGIFVPNKKTIVNSQGDVFEDFPDTGGVYCADIFANPVPDLFIVDGQPHPILFDGQVYSKQDKSCIVMQHSNHGITFDLDAIRNHYNLRIERFTSRVGLFKFDDKRCSANFYVLVDGQLRFSLLEYSEKGVLNDVSVKLEDTDRFLTLATTENVDPIEYMANSTLYENWCVFAEPVLELEKVGGERH